MKPYVLICVYFFNIDPTGETAAVHALMRIQPNCEIEALEYAHYLIVEKGAICSAECYLDDEDKDNNEHLVRPIEWLRNWTYPLDSPEYKMKMDIVEALKTQGLDYWATEIPQGVLEEIKKVHPSDWQTYITKY